MQRLGRNRTQPGRNLAMRNTALRPAQQLVPWRSEAGNVVALGKPGTPCSHPIGHRTTWSRGYWTVGSSQLWLVPAPHGITRKGWSPGALHPCGTTPGGAPRPVISPRPLMLNAHTKVRPLGFAATRVFKSIIGPPFSHRKAWLVVGFNREAPTI